MANPWEKLDEESESAFLAFTEWMHGSRSLREPSALCDHLRVQHGVTLSPETIVQHRKRHAWQKRANAWQNHVHAQRLKMISGAIAKKSAKLAVQQFRGRELAIAKTIRSLEKLEDDNAEDQNAVQSAIRKAIENLGLIVLDHADQLRRLSAVSGPGSGEEASETEEVIPPIPPEPGPVQYGHPEEEAVLGAPEGDLPGDS